MRDERQPTNWQGIVLVGRDSGLTGKTLRLWTKECGRVSVFVPEGRRRVRWSGYLLPGVELRATVVKDEGGWRLIEAEGKTLVDSLGWTYEDWRVYCFLTAWIDELFAAEEPDTKVYRLLSTYFSKLAYKNRTIATLIVCWQLTVLAGYDPSAVILRTRFLPLTANGKKTLTTMLKYQWSKTETIYFSKSSLTELGNALLYYAKEYIGMERPFENVFVVNVIDK